MHTTDPLAAINTRSTPQSRPADPRQVPNNAGGHGFQIGDDALVHRFLTIGTTGGTFYVSEQKLTADTAAVVLRAARERPEWLVARVVDVSTNGRAPRVNPAIFALAAAAGLGDLDGRRAALVALPDVCRTGTHLLTFVGYVEQFRGWGRSLRRAVSGWFTGRDVDRLAYQMVKYRQRGGWSQRDVLRLAHPSTPDERMNSLLRWVARGEVSDRTPAMVHGFAAAQAATTVAEWRAVLEQHTLPWEALPDAALSEPDVWRSLLENGLPQTALMRQLPRLTRLGVLDDKYTRDRVCARLADSDRLRSARVHPMNVLLAAKTYAGGASLLGRSTWQANRHVVDALDAAFYNAYGAIEPTGKRTLLALDVSGSMGGHAAGMPISCREASAALALVTMATEQDVTVVGFTAAGRSAWRGGGGGGRRRSLFGLDTGVSELAISPRQRLDDAVRSIAGMSFGATDCALPAQWARETGRDFDSIAIYTDSETWAGGEHPHQSLKRYRDHVGHDVRQAVLGMTATDISIADPTDPHSLDIAGLDSAVPTLLADFSRGNV